ncbi:uncharacterized protein LOC127440507 isoform X2 [Myxocyprinus asiaticus]|uniref:uncharacterized protein LOC127440507 isoform X2 n=1 Tax=Myxocyprinus asiaticus TaxID=70543 RepID=UPI0022238398|nr:uncharacterized protein LOC127440507 isoform X2 [Myxocyprinus asiaticus]
MHFILTLAFLVDLSWGLPKDIVIKFERSVLVNGSVEERILVNGAAREFDDQPVVRLIKDEALGMIVKNEHATSINGTYIRLRECKLREYRVLRLSDRFQLNGKDYLALDSVTGSWTALEPEARNLQTWARAAECLEKTQLKEECEEFIKLMNDTQNKEGLGVLRVMALVLTTFLLIGLAFISLLIFKRHGQQPGGEKSHIVYQML